MRKFLKNTQATVQDIGAAVAILVTIMVSVLVVFNIAASVDSKDIDTSLQSALSEGTDVTFAQNATKDTLDQTATFYTIAPLVVVVLIAVVILSYVMQIGGATRP